MGFFAAIKSAVSVALPWILSIVPPAALVGWVLWLWDEVVASATAHPLSMASTCLLALCVGCLSGWYSRKLICERKSRKTKRLIRALPDGVKGCLGIMWQIGKPVSDRRFAGELGALAEYGLLTRVVGSKERWVISPSAAETISGDKRIREEIEQCSQSIKDQLARESSESWKAEFDRLTYEEKDALICVWKVPDGEFVDGVEEAHMISEGLTRYMWVEEISPVRAILHLEPNARKMMDEHSEAILKLGKERDTSDVRKKA